MAKFFNNCSKRRICEIMFENEIFLCMRKYHVVDQRILMQLNQGYELVRTIRGGGAASSMLLASVRIYTSLFCGLLGTRYTLYYSIVMLPFGHAVGSTLF
jgi:hypothetical protein